MVSAWSFDIDSMDPSAGPGTGTPEIGGLTTAQALEIVRGCKGLNLVSLQASSLMAIRVVAFSNGGYKIRDHPWIMSDNFWRFLTIFDIPLRQPILPSNNQFFWVISVPSSLMDVPLERINILKGNYWFLRIELMGRCQNYQNLTFQKFSMSKIIQIFLIFFLWGISI